MYVASVLLSWNTVSFRLDVMQISILEHLLNAPKGSQQDQKMGGKKEKRRCRCCGEDNKDNKDGREGGRVVGGGAWGHPGWNQYNRHHSKSYYNSLSVGAALRSAPR